eukprot:TRINITY_DN2433_c0_g1_i2.p1 TRINITY_DN2433_c0_g1~~TRINITY_DN2433_c0_g1_i2.p1  ORF type:complete len:162 (+),score=32.33 TRINITY_DN2433_c0_g1_i2:173-658(+)
MPRRRAAALPVRAPITCMFLAACAAAAVYCVAHALKASMRHQGGGRASVHRAACSFEGTPLMAHRRSDDAGARADSGAVPRRKMLQQLAKGVMVAGAAAAGDPSPSAALFEDVLKEGGCPKYDEVKGPSVAAFDMDKVRWSAVRYVTVAAAAHAVTAVVCM